MSQPRASRPNRVPIDAYRDNLTRMVRMARHGGIAPVLITAPSNHVRGHEPTYLAVRHLRTLTELVPLHQQYLQATREVAAATGARLCDVAEAFDALPAPRDKYFRADGIHLTSAGDQQIATVLAPCISDALRGASRSAAREDERLTDVP